MSNGVMMQYFHWYSSEDVWKEVIENVEDLAKAGITSLWLPPAYKGSGGANSVGYDVYDMYDLGEFDQKGSVKTKYGTKDEYLECIKVAQANGVHIYGDVVINHMMGADELEETEAHPVAYHDRNQKIGDLQPVKVWTGFTFPGRKNKYSSFKWHWYHFDAVDYNQEASADEQHIFLFKGKNFEGGVDNENGNYDYLMGADLDYDSEEVKQAIKNWGHFYVNTTGVNGFRFDAVKHVRASFFREFMDDVQASTGKELWAVGEYWSSDLPSLHAFIEKTAMSVFDAPLHYNFAHASKQGREYDLRKIFDNTVVKENPVFAVTLVSNHDSQPLQALESVVESWFKPLAYSLILLRKDGYPCVFYPDYYGASYKDKGNDGNEYEIHMSSHKYLIDIFLKARAEFALGAQWDYFDYPNVIGWTRQGKLHQLNKDQNVTEEELENNKEEQKEEDETQMQRFLDLMAKDYKLDRNKLFEKWQRFVVDEDITKNGSSKSGQEGVLIRDGKAIVKGGMAVVISNGDDGKKWMQFRDLKMVEFIDITGHSGDEIVPTCGLGWGHFPVKAGSVSVWVPKTSWTPLEEKRETKDQKEESEEKLTDEKTEE